MTKIKFRVFAGVELARVQPRTRTARSAESGPGQNTDAGVFSLHSRHVPRGYDRILVTTRIVQSHYAPATSRFDQAEALFRYMGMDSWTEQAEGMRGRIDRCEPFRWFAPYVDGPPLAE